MELTSSQKEILNDKISTRRRAINGIDQQLTAIKANLLPLFSLLTEYPHAYNRAFILNGGASHIIGELTIGGVDHNEQPLGPHISFRQKDGTVTDTQTSKSLPPITFGLIITHSYVDPNYMYSPDEDALILETTDNLTAMYNMLRWLVDHNRIVIDDIIENLN